MKNKFTKLISSLLILAFLVSSFAVLSFANEVEEEEEQIKPAFRVTVSYVIDITADDADDAMDRAEKLIQDGEVYPTNIEWDTID
jgi:hypothetical protein